MTPELPGPAVGPASPAVNAALRARMEQLLSEYGRLRGNLAAMQQRLATATGEAKTTDSSVRLTVGPRGELRTLEITPRAYRQYSPSELAAEILALTRRATDDVQRQLAEVMAPFLPTGVSYADAVAGRVDPAAWAPRQPLTAETFDEWWPGFGNHGREAAQ